MATPATPVNQQQTAPVNNNSTQDPGTDQNMEDDNSSDSSDDAEVVQLREQVTTLTTDLDNMLCITSQPPRLTEKTQAKSSKPNPPEMFDGTPYKLQTFLTQCRAFMSYYPTQFNQEGNKTMYAAGRLKGTAAQWFEPVLREYTTIELSELTPRTFMLYNNYMAFEKALHQAFGTVNEKGQAERRIKAIKQTKSASEMAAEFQQLASKLPWDQDVLMSMFFDALKEPVQAELYKLERPATLVEYIGMAVRIDDYQYSWRTRNSKRNHQGNRPRYDANQTKRRNGNTSYGTESGPMEIGAAKRDKKNDTCYNCGKKGHHNYECKNPVKTNQKYRPIPEGDKKVRFTNTQDDAPQTGIKTPNAIVRMTRSGYDKTETGRRELRPSNDLILSLEELKQRQQEEEERDEKGRFRGRKTAHDNSIKAILEERKNTMRGETIAMVRTTENIEPKQPEELMPDRPPRSKLHNEPINARDINNSVNLQKQLDALRLGETAEETQVRLQRRKTTLKILKGLRKTDEQLWTETYPETYDGEGNRYWHSMRERYIHQAREHARTIDMPEICVRAYHRELAENPRHPEPPFHSGDDVRTYPTHPEHDQISWMSCQTHFCETHLREKQGQDCFPIPLPAQPNNKPYSRQETLGYKVWHWYDSIGVANAKFDKELFKQQRAEYINKPIEEWQDTDPGKEAELRYQSFLHQQDDTHDYEACDNPNDCGHDHIEHARNDTPTDRVRATQGGRPNCLEIDVRIKGTWLKALIDSGATINCMGPKTINRLKLPWGYKKNPTPVRNLEGEIFNFEGGMITRQIDHLKVFVNGKNQGIDFDVLKIHDHDLVLGQPWLYKYNPRINWRTGQVDCEVDPSDDMQDL
ncbi:hypothetical protein NM208_g9929 [Fusarium decemcellulare]|uniref:Uncharacterized protein n=1 Tax=Fusarium decemcellulare TaxID=57161 RepID=A0ACC1RZP8_9HYPO|nr:hypothetical protein NM208_g9929 [Fusarium decemcellulare]